MYATRLMQLHKCGVALMNRLYMGAINHLPSVFTDTLDSGEFQSFINGLNCRPLPGRMVSFQAFNKFLTPGFPTKVHQAVDDIRHKNFLLSLCLLDDFVPKRFWIAIDDEILWRFGIPESEEQPLVSRTFVLLMRDQR